MPTLENVMYNYMNCNQMMFGSKVRYGVTYKTNQKSFSIYRRKFEHNYKIPVDSSNLEGAKCIELVEHEMFLCTNVDKIIMYDTRQKSIGEPLGQLPIELLEDKTAREPNEVIAIQKCQNDEYIAVISGKKLIGNEEKINQLFIFQKKPSSGDERAQFEQKYRIVLKTNEMFKQTSMNFHFVNEPGKQRSKLLFAKIDCVF